MRKLLIVACVLLGVGWVRAEEPAPAAPVVRWEYLFVNAVIWNEEWHPRFINGKDVAGWQTTLLPDYANKLGDEGWELVTVAIPLTPNQSAYAASKPHYRLIFKRQKR